VLWVTFGQPPDVPGALARLAAAFGEDVTGYAKVEERAAVVRAVLADKRALLVADDVWDADLARLLRELAPAAALLTTRQHEVARAFAPRSDTRLERLTPDASVGLLRALVTVDVPDAELARAAAVADGLPLTLTLLAPLLDDEAARRAIAETEAATGLPADDPVRFGAAKLVEQAVARVLPPPAPAPAVRTTSAQGSSAAC